MGGTAGTGAGAGSAPGSVITSSAAGGPPNGAGASAGGGGNAASVITPWPVLPRQSRQAVVGWAVPAQGSRSGETSEAGFPAPKSVITSLAGFEPALRSQPRRSHRNPRGLQISRRRLPTHTGGFLDAPQRPAEPP